jgi:beta-glucosidase
MEYLRIGDCRCYAGKEVVQLYLAYPDVGDDAAHVNFPMKVLRGFEKIYLEKDETKSVQFNLTRRDLSYWDVVRQNWVMPTEGKITIRIGASSRDLRLLAWY